MAVVFKYKYPISQTYAPGLSRPGAAGPDGVKGDSGNALYFIDFDLDNSYNIEQALQKIDNNKLLSINSDEELKHRKYKINDILLSNTGKCYRIKEIDKESLFTNYSFDIEYLGEMNIKNSCPVKFVVIYDFTNAVFYKEGSAQGSYSGDIIKMYGTEELSCYPTNRTEKPYTSKFSVNNKDYSLIGSWIKIVGYSTEDTTPKFDPKDGGIFGAKHSFVIQLNNNKNISCNSIPLEYNDDPIQTDGEASGYSINFKKKLEYPNIKTFDNLSLSNGTFVNSLLYELIPDNNIKLSYNESLNYTSDETNGHPEGLPAKDIARYNAKVPECTTAFLSDYSMDDMHPSGNNIRCTINNDRTMWYRSGIKAGEDADRLEGQIHSPNSITTTADFYQTMYSDVFVNENDEDEEYTIKLKKDIVDSLKSYGAGFSFTPINLALKEKIVDEDGNITYKTYKSLDSSTSSLMSKNSFPQYAIGLSLSEASEEDIQKELSSLFRFGFIYDGTNIDNDYYYSSNSKYFGYYHSTFTGKIDNRSLISISNSQGKADFYLPDGTQADYKITLEDANATTKYNIIVSELNTNENFGEGKSSLSNIPVAYNILKDKDKGRNTQHSNILQYPKYPSYSNSTAYCTNYKGGNSLYFSGINDVMDTYENIFNYITNDSNTYSIVTTFEKTKEMITNVIPIIVDTSFKNSKVYVRFGQGSGRSTLITGLRIRKGGRDVVNYTYR